MQCEHGCCGIRSIGTRLGLASRRCARIVKSVHRVSGRSYAPCVPCATANLLSNSCLRGRGGPPDFSAYVAQKNRDGRERPHRADPQVRKAKTTSDRVCARSGCRTKNWLGAGSLLKLANREVLLGLRRKTHDSRRNWGGGFWHTGARRSPGASSARWRPSARPSSRDPRAQRRRPRSRPPPASSPRRPSYTGRCQDPPPRAARS